MEAPLKILYIDSTQGTGGATKSLLNMLKYLDRSRFKPVLLCHREGPFTRSFMNEGVIILKQEIKLMQAKTFDPDFGINLTNQLVRRLIKLLGMSLKIGLIYGTLLRDYVIIFNAVKKHNIGLVHFNSYSDHYLPLASAIAQWLKIPTVFHVRGRVRPGRHVQFLTKYVTGFIYVSKFVQDYFLAKGAISRHNFCIYDGRDPREYDRSCQGARFNIRGTYNIPTTHKIVVCIGTLSRGKGQHTFVKASSLICQQREDVSFLIVGDNVPYEDDIKSELRALISKFHIEKRVLLLGQRTDIPELLAQSDISVVSTELPEALCGVNIEAMAAKIPVVSTDVGAIPEVVTQAETGLLIPPGDHQAMAQAVLSLLENEEAAFKLAECGYQRFLERFDASKVTIDLQKSYEQIIRAVNRG